MQVIAAGKSSTQHHRRKQSRCTTAALPVLRRSAVVRLDSNTTHPSCIASLTLNFATSKRKTIPNGDSLEWPRTSISKCFSLFSLYTEGQGNQWYYDKYS